MLSFKRDFLALRLRFRTCRDSSFWSILRLRLTRRRASNLCSRPRLLLLSLERFLARNYWSTLRERLTTLLDSSLFSATTSRFKYPFGLLKRSIVNSSIDPLRFSVFFLEWYMGVLTTETCYDGFWFSFLRLPVKALPYRFIILLALGFLTERDDFLERTECVCSIYSTSSAFGCFFLRFTLIVLLFRLLVYGDVNIVKSGIIVGLDFSGVVPIVIPLRSPTCCLSNALVLTMSLSVLFSIKSCPLSGFSTLREPR